VINSSSDEASSSEDENNDDMQRVYEENPYKKMGNAKDTIHMV
jgi:hypothetical protein